MAKCALLVLTISVFCGAVCLPARAQAVAESAVIHANSGIATGVAKAMGGNIQQGLASAQSQFSYPQRTSRRGRHALASRSRGRVHSTGRSPLAISSVVGGPVRCGAAPNPAVPQAKPAGAPSGNCDAKTPAPVANAKSNPNEITVSF
jgi:hypothetical protein